MNWLQQPWLETLGWTLLHSLWQLSAIAAIAFLALVVLRRHSSQLRYAIACVLFGLMMATTVGTYAYLWSQRPHALAVPASVNISPSAFIPPTISIEFVPPIVHAPAPSLRERVLSALHLTAPYAASLYLAGAAIVMLRLLGGYAALRRLGAGALATPDHQALLEELRRRFRIQTTVQLLHSRQVEVPTVFGAWRPMILLPLTTTTGLSTEHLTCLLLHELAHVRRHDYVANLAQSLIETLLFYHPAVIWLSAYIRQEREHCCDDIAIAHSNRAHYAAALVSMESLRVTPGLALGASGGSLVERIRRIFNAAAPRSANRRIINASAILTAAMLITVFAFYLAACSRNDAPQAATAPAPANSESRAQSSVPAATAPSLNRPVEVGDVLSIGIYELLAAGALYTDTYPVNEKGEVHLPYVGDLVVVGKTPRQISEAISRAAIDKHLLQNAEVRVSHTNEVADLRPLQSGERVMVKVFELEAPGAMANDTAVIDENGDVLVLHLGNIHLAGLTPTQASENISSTAVEKHILRAPAYTQVLRIGGDARRASVEAPLPAPDNTVADDNEKILLVATPPHAPIEQPTSAGTDTTVFDLRDLLIVPTSDDPGHGPSAKAADREMERLIEMIKETVDPSSWQKETGAFIESARGMMLVHHQTPANILAIQNLLGILRKEHARQLSIESRMFFVDETLFQKLLAMYPGLLNGSLHPDGVSAGNILTDKELSEVLRMTQADPATVSVAAPRVTIFNSQTATITVQRNGKGTLLKITAASSDEKTVAMKLELQLDTADEHHQLSSLVSLPDASTALIGGQKIKGSGENGQPDVKHLIVLVRPKIIIQSEIEQNLFGTGYDRPTGLPTNPAGGSMPKGNATDPASRVEHH